MKFLLISGGGDGLGLALRLKDEGHDVAVWIREGRCKKNYLGLLHHVDKWEEFLDGNTIVIFDSNGGGRTADRLRARGHFVATGGAFADQLELDRQTAFELMQQAGIRVPMYKAFTSWDKARAYVKEKGGRLCFKPSGDSVNQLGSYLAYDVDDMLEMLDLMQEKHHGRPEFLLQDFVKGVEVSSEGWFNGTHFMRPFNHTIERKSLMNDNIGPSTRCAGNVVWTCDEDPIITEGILRMEDLLREREYLGPIDLNTIVNEEGVWALEFTPRFGYEALPALFELLKQPLAETLSSLARMERPSSLPLETSVATALFVSIPPYPTDKAPQEGIPVRGFTKQDRPHLYFYDVQLDERLHVVTTPAYGAIVTITGKGDSIVEAMEGPLEIAKRAKIPDKQFRTDLTSVFVRARAELEPFLKLKEVDHASAPNLAAVATSAD
jgi:phosphoribosylamine--glycine ligase